VSNEPRILVCDDEPQILRALRVVLVDAGFEVVTAASAEEALDAAAVRPPQAAIIDLILPDRDGVQVTRALREWSDMPIVVLSAVEEEAEKVRALNAGADDYVTKPFGPEELVARVHAVLRRVENGGEEPSIVVGDLELDLARHSVTVAGEPVHLTPTEFSLLRTLVRYRGRLMTHSTLLREVWGPVHEEDTPLLRSHVANLRRKIEPEPSNPRYVTTDPGIGYRFTG
jgi:two-component system KDP operon response regulator KdpE